MIGYSEIREVKIKFKEYGRNGASLIKGTYNNLPVYRHRDYEDRILPDHTYICDLSINYNTMGNYFAIPTEEVEEPADVQSVPEEKKSIDESFVGVVRISPDELRSSMFTEEGYRVKISPDGKKMLISPFSHSSNRCRNGILTLTGLGKLIPFDGAREYSFSLSGDTIRICV